MGAGESFYALFRDIHKDAILCFLTLLRYVVGVYAEPASDLMAVT